MPTLMGPLLAAADAAADAAGLAGADALAAELAAGLAELAGLAVVGEALLAGFAGELLAGAGDDVGAVEPQAARVNPQATSAV